MSLELTLFYFFKCLSLATAGLSLQSVTLHTMWRRLHFVWRLQIVLEHFCVVALPGCLLVTVIVRSWQAQSCSMRTMSSTHPRWPTIHRQMAFTCWQICLSCIFRIITPIGTSPYLLFVSHTTALQATTGFLSSLLVYSREATCILDTLLPCSYGLYSDGGIQPRSSDITIGAWARAPDGTRK